VTGMDLGALMVERRCRSSGVLVGRRLLRFRECSRCGRR
jgi:hypothetical protein